MSITDDLRIILRNDPVFTGLITGGVLDRPLTASGPMWEADPITGIKTLKPTAVMLEPQEFAAPFGVNFGPRMDIWQEPDLYLYGDRLELDTLMAADERAIALLHGPHIGLAEIDATPYRARPLVADELPGSIWHIFRRFRITTVRHIQEVSNNGKGDRHAD